ncbi:MAG: InlB B-repeat-containing protein [Oscillospiraceae bacterium]|nr:InlB B-repeat-containing protein [Oscillospiraceae bacterium]
MLKNRKVGKLLSLVVAMAIVMSVIVILPAMQVAAEPDGVSLIAARWEYFHRSDREGDRESTASFTQNQILIGMYGNSGFPHEAVFAFEFTPAQLADIQAALAENLSITFEAGAAVAYNPAGLHKLYAYVMPYELLDRLPANTFNLSTQLGLVRTSHHDYVATYWEGVEPIDPNPVALVGESVYALRLNEALEAWFDENPGADTFAFVLVQSHLFGENPYVVPSPGNHNIRMRPRSRPHPSINPHPGLIIDGRTIDNSGISVTTIVSAYYSVINATISGIAAGARNTDRVEVIFYSNGNYATVNRPIGDVQDGSIDVDAPMVNNNNDFFDVTVNVTNAAGNVLATYTVFSEELRTTRVVFNSTGGTHIPPLEVVAQQSLITEPAEDPFLLGYDFAGWFTTLNAAPGTQWDFATRQVVFADTVNGVLTLYAGWEESPYSIGLRFRAPTADRGNPPRSMFFEVGDGQVFYIPGRGSLEKNGYTFIGWNSAEDGSGDFFRPGYVFDTTGETGNVEFYAVWVESNTAAPRTIETLSYWLPGIQVRDMTIDNHGNIYFTSFENVFINPNRPILGGGPTVGGLFRITPEGEVERLAYRDIAVSHEMDQFDNTTLGELIVANPWGIAFDSEFNMFVAESGIQFEVVGHGAGGNRIRRIQNLNAGDPDAAPLFTADSEVTTIVVPSMALVNFGTTSYHGIVGISFDRDQNLLIGHAIYRHHFIYKLFNENLDRNAAPVFGDDLLAIPHRVETAGTGGDRARIRSLVGDLEGNIFGNTEAYSTVVMFVYDPENGYQGSDFRGMTDANPSFEIVTSTAVGGGGNRHFVGGPIDWDRTPGNVLGALRVGGPRGMQFDPINNQIIIPSQHNFMVTALDLNNDTLVSLYGRGFNTNVATVPTVGQMFPDRDDYQSDLPVPGVFADANFPPLDGTPIPVNAAGGIQLFDVMASATNRYGDMVIITGNNAAAPPVQLHEDGFRPYAPIAMIITNHITVNFNANAVGVAGTVPTSVQGRPFTSIEVPDGSGLSYDDGMYIFSHWNTASDDSGETFLPGDYIELGRTDITLYAQYEFNAGLFEILIDNGDIATIANIAGSAYLTLGYLNESDLVGGEVFVIAFFNANNVLVGTEILGYIDSDASTVTIDTVSAVPLGATRARMMVWNSFGIMRPLAPAVPILNPVV